MTTSAFSQQLQRTTLCRQPLTAKQAHNVASKMADINSESSPVKPGCQLCSRWIYMQLFTLLSGSFLETKSV